MSAWTGPPLGPIGTDEYLVVAIWVLVVGLCCLLWRGDAVTRLTGSMLVLVAVTVDLVAVSRFATDRFPVAVPFEELAVGFAVVQAVVAIALARALARRKGRSPERERVPSDSPVDPIRSHD